MAIKLQPMFDLVLVKPGKREEVTKSGIVLPDTAKEKPQEGEVLAVGPGRITEAGKKVPMDVAIGDIVVYSKYGGNEITVDNEELILLHETDILAKKTA
jgi:chaperonin GroES